MSFVDHTLDDRWIRSCCIHWTFAEIVARYEERSMEAEALQSIQQFACVQIWPIIIGQRNNVVLQTIIDIVIIGYFPQQRSRIVQSRGSRRCRIRVANTVLILTARILTIINRCPTIASSGAALSGSALFVSESRPTGTVPTASGGGGRAVAKG